MVETRVTPVFLVPCNLEVDAQGRIVDIIPVSSWASGTTIHPEVQDGVESWCMRVPMPAWKEPLYSDGKTPDAEALRAAFKASLVVIDGDRCETAVSDRIPL